MLPDGAEVADERAARDTDATEAVESMERVERVERVEREDCDIEATTESAYVVSG